MCKSDVFFVQSFIKALFNFREQKESVSIKNENHLLK
jgi:hypothetical protein